MNVMDAQRVSTGYDDRAGIRAWPDLDALPGVGEAVEAVRSGVAAVQRLPANRRGWAKTAAAASIRAARASALLDGGSVGIGEESSGTGDSSDAERIVTDPIFVGALRISAELGDLTRTWQHAPLQALARLHTLAAADLVDDEELGRPRSEPGVTARLGELARVVGAGPWSGPVMVAVVHGELLALKPFSESNGLIARAAARLTMITTGLDPQALTVPEVGHLRAGEQYRNAADGFASGGAAGVAEWIRHVCGALRVGCKEARSIATAAGDGAQAS